MIQGAFFFLIGGIVLLVMGVKEATLGAVVDPTPQEIALLDLANDGYGDNAHVTVTNFFMVQDVYVYEAPIDHPEHMTTGYDKIWVPLVSIESDWYAAAFEYLDEDGYFSEGMPPLRNIPVILRSSKIGSEATLGTYGSHDAITGIIVNEIESIGDEERRLLEESYPNVEFRDCLILDHMRELPDGGNATGFIAGGGVGVVIGIGMIIGGIVSATKKKEVKPAPNRFPVHN